MSKDINKLMFSFSFPKKNKRTHNLDNFNGYGKYRKGMSFPYGTFNEYRDKSGIYYIKNITTGRIYIGSSKDIGRRLSKHFSQLRVGNHPNGELLQDFIKYGQNDFTFGAIEYTETDLKNKERDYQLTFNISELYNLQIKDTYHSDTQKNSWNNRDYSSHRTSEYRQKMKKLKSNRIGKFGKFNKRLIEVYDNSDEACKANNIAKSTLLGCCNGSKKSAGGFIFHYLDDNGNIIKEGKGRKRTIVKQNDDIV